MGRHLVPALVNSGHDAWVFDLVPPNEPCDSWIKGDVLSHGALEAALRDSEIDAVIHLAAVVFEPSCRENPQTTFDLNLGATINVLEACRGAAKPPRVVLALSSAIYGPVSGENIGEDTPLRPWTVYGASKASCDVYGLTYWTAYDLEVVRVVPFNTTGPGESSRFVVSDWARQVARIEAGRQEPVIWTGDTSAIRDFVDVRDVASAYVAILGSGRPGERYNVATGNGVRVGSILEILREQTNLDFEARISQDRMRPSDIPLQVGSYAKLNRDTGWEPQISMSQSVGDLLDHWRQYYREETNEA